MKKEERPLVKIGVFLVGLLRRHAVSASVLLYTLGLLWVCLFPLVCITTGESKCRGTYFSENALGAGNARSSFASHHIVQGEAIGDVAAIGEVEEAMKQVIPNSRTHHSGAVYGILKPLVGADRRESIIIVNHLYTSGLGLSLGISKALSDVTWLSKNVILVEVSDERQLAAWIKDYYSESSDMVRGGTIIGGIVLDFEKPDEGIDHVEIDVAGIDGKLPNLDLVNLVIYILNSKIRAPVTIGSNPLMDEKQRNKLSDTIMTLSKNITPLRRTSVKTYLSEMDNLIRFMRDVAFGNSGWHAYLLPYDIHSLTVKVHSNSKKSNKVQTEAMGEAVELIVRSISNLSERFHQSYFLYLLPNLRKFVSIGEFFGPLLMVLSPSAICLILILHTASQESISGLLVAFLIFTSTLSFSLGVLRFVVPVLGTESILVMYIPSILAVVLLRRFECTSLETLKVFLIFFSFIVHVMIGMFNFPFAFISAAFTTPLYALTCIQSRSSRLVRLVMILWCAFSANAFRAIPYLMPPDSGWTSYNEDPLVKAYDETGSFHLVYLVLVFWPAHILCSIIIVV